MIKKENKNEGRKSRHIRVRNKISGTSERPRLCVYRSLNAIYAQIINDENGTTIVSCSTIEKSLENKLKDKNKVEQAIIIGEETAKRAVKKGVKKVVFDRGGYLYTGRVAALAEAARKSGLEF